MGIQALQKRVDNHGTDGHPGEVCELTRLVDALTRAISKQDLSEIWEVSLSECSANAHLKPLILAINRLIGELQAQERTRRAEERSMVHTISELEKQVRTIEKKAEAIRELSRV